jgi:hypothetical protein
MVFNFKRTDDKQLQHKEEGVGAGGVVIFLLLQAFSASVHA